MTTTAVQGFAGLGVCGDTPQGRGALHLQSVLQHSTGAVITLFLCKGFKCFAKLLCLAPTI